MFNLEAMQDNVILKMRPKVTAKGAIRLSDGAAEESDFCDVVAVGPKCVDLSIGEVVLRPAPADYEYTDDDDHGQLYLIVHEKDVPARVRNGS